MGSTTANLFGIMAMAPAKNVSTASVIPALVFMRAGSSGYPVVFGNDKKFAVVAIEYLKMYRYFTGNSWNEMRSRQASPPKRLR